MSVFTRTPESVPQSLDSRAFNALDHPISCANHTGVKTYLAASEAAKPTTTVVQPAQAGARRMIVPQIKGTEYGTATRLPNCSIRSKSFTLFHELKVKAAAMTIRPMISVTSLLTSNCS